MSRKRKNKRKVNKVEYVTQSVLTLDQFVDKFKDSPKLKGRKLQWIKLLGASKLQCPVTKAVVDHCRYDYRETSDSYHYNFYSTDGEFFTVDHIIPISKGGHKMHIDNLQPMIGTANFEKDDVIPETGGMYDPRYLLENNKTTN